MSKSEFKSLPLGRLILLGIVITTVMALFIQNLNLLVVISFLGYSSPSLPLSLVMLAAFLGGGLIAGIFNAINSWVYRRRLEEFSNSVAYSTSQSARAVNQSDRASQAKTTPVEPVDSYSPKPSNTRYQEPEEEYEDYEEELEEEEERVIDVKYINKDFKRDT